MNPENEYSIMSAEEYRSFAESDDEVESSKTSGTASEEVWMDILRKYPKLVQSLCID
jgi:hypothetical protein